MVNIKMLAAAIALASLGMTAPAVAEDMAPSVGTDPNAVHHDRGEADDASGDDRMNKEDDDNVDASGSVPGAEEAMHQSAYKKTYPEEPEISELDE